MSDISFGIKDKEKGKYLYHILNEFSNSMLNENSTASINLKNTGLEIFEKDFTGSIYTEIIIDKEYFDIYEVKNEYFCLSSNNLKKVLNIMNYFIKNYSKCIFEVEESFIICYPDNKLKGIKIRLDEKKIKQQKLNINIQNNFDNIEISKLVEALKLLNFIDDEATKEIYDDISIALIVKNGNLFIKSFGYDYLAMLSDFLLCSSTDINESYESLFSRYGFRYIRDISKNCENISFSIDSKSPLVCKMNINKKIFIKIALTPRIEGS